MMTSDCLPHPVGPVASLRLGADATCVALHAEFTLSAGDAISISVDEGDYLDFFERYGFFDATSVLHTAEVRACKCSPRRPAVCFTPPRCAHASAHHDALPSPQVPVTPHELLAIALGRWGGDSGGEGGGGGEGGEGKATPTAAIDTWRIELAAAQAAIGCDEAMHAWWVPDHRLEACPLFAAVRAMLVREDEVAEAAAIIQVPNTAPMTALKTAEGEGADGCNGEGEGVDDPLLGAWRREFNLHASAHHDALHSPQADGPLLGAWRREFNLQRPIRDEALAREHMIALLEAHKRRHDDAIAEGAVLSARYDAAVAEGAEGMGGGALGTALSAMMMKHGSTEAEVARRLLEFERQLLGEAVEALRAAGREGADTKMTLAHVVAGPSAGMHLERSYHA